jgi:hypothetical protein
MGYKRPQETTRTYLESAPLPNHGGSYTVVSHSDIINTTQKLFNDLGLKVDRELYRANVDAKVAQGVYHISPLSNDGTTDKELGMMFGWTNSYDKSVRFQCAVGAYVMVCNNGMVAGEMSFARKHTGSADYDITEQINKQLGSVDKHFGQIIADRDSFRKTDLSIKEQSELVGRLYCDKDILDLNQISIVKQEIKKPSYDYQADQDNAWAFYNHVTHALKKTHPRSWLSDSQKFHKFMVDDVLGQMGIKKSDALLDIVDLEMEEDNQLTISFDF